MSPQLSDLSHVSVRNLSVERAPDGPVPPPLPTSAFYSLQSPSGDVWYVSKECPVYTRAVFEAMPRLPVPKDTYKVHLRLWTRTPDSPHYTVHYSLHIDLRNLRPLSQGTSFLPDPDLAANACVWGFGDRLYCLPSDVRNHAVLELGKTLVRATQSKRSYSRDDIRQLNRLTAGVREFEQLKAELSREIDTFYGPKARNSTETAPEAAERLTHRIRTLTKSLGRQMFANDALRSEIYTVRKSIHTITSVVQEASPSFAELSTETVEIVDSQIEPVFESLQSAIYPQIVDCIGQLAKVVSEAFPISVMDSSPHFCISGIEFPSSVAEILDACYYEKPPSLAVDSKPQNEPITHSVDNVNAGLLQIVTLMAILADILNLDMKHALEIRKAMPYLVDPDSAVLFPLFYDKNDTEKVSFSDCGRDTVKNTKFERALQLLTRNLTFMMSDIADLYFQYYHDGKSHSLTNNVPKDCQDNYLWNLQYLLLFLTARQ